VARRSADSIIVAVCLAGLLGWGVGCGGGEPSERPQRESSSAAVLEGAPPNKETTRDRATGRLSRQSHPIRTGARPSRRNRGADSPRQERRSAGSQTAADPGRQQRIGGSTPSVKANAPGHESTEPTKQGLPAKTPDSAAPPPNDESTDPAAGGGETLAPTTENQRPPTAETAGTAPKRQS